MEMNPYAVLVRTDEQNRIIAINSSAFVADADGWTKIDEGWGDKYHHAQGNYLDKPLMDERGVYRYKLENGQAMERTENQRGAGSGKRAAESPGAGCGRQKRICGRLHRRNGGGGVRG